MVMTSAFGSTFLSKDGSENIENRQETDNIASKVRTYMHY